MKSDIIKTVSFSMAIGILLGIIGAYSVRGDSIGVALYYLIAVVGLGVSLVLGTIYLLYRGDKKEYKFKKWLWRGSLAILIVAIFQTILVPNLGKLLYQKDVTEAKNYCEDLAVKVKEYKNQTGDYSHDLKSVESSVHRLPRLMSEFYAYGFYFDEHEPVCMFRRADAGVKDVMVYNISTDKWYEWSLR